MRKKMYTLVLLTIIFIMGYSLLENFEEFQSNEEEKTSLTVPKSSKVSMGIEKVGEFNDEEINGAWTMGVYVLGDYAYLVSDMWVTSSDYIEDYNNGLEIIDISDPTNPIKVGQFDDGGLVKDVYVLGDYAYVAKGYDGFMIINITDSTNPIKVGQYDDYYVQGTDIISIYVVGNYAYILDCWYGGLEIIDISNPIGPCKVGEFMNGIYDRVNMQSIYVDGDYAYIACEEDGLYIIDISDPTNPTKIGEFNISGYAMDVFVSGSYAYITNMDIGLEIIDISDPTTPVEVGQYDTDEIWNIYVEGDYAYISEIIENEGFGGLAVIDISDPTTPKRVGEFSKYWDIGWIEDIFVSNSYVYLASSWDGMEILCVSDVENTISITTPDSSISWENGSSHQIFWNFTGYIPLVDIELYKDGIFEMIIDLNVPHTPYYSWNIPSDITNSIYYQMKITDASDSSVYDVSEYFEISNNENEESSTTIAGYDLILILNTISIASIIFVLNIRKKQ